MTSERTRQFMGALQDAERTGDPADLVALFDEEARLSKLARPDGRGAAEFWGEYLSAFEEIRSTFTDVAEEGDLAVLEWTSEVRRPGGQPAGYGGVSVLRWREGKVSDFRTYYDTAAFVSPLHAQAEAGARGGDDG